MQQLLERAAASKNIKHGSINGNDNDYSSDDGNNGSSAAAAAAIVDDSLGAYMTDLLWSSWCSATTPSEDDILSLPDFDLLCELIMEHCGIPNDKAVKILQQIAQAIFKERGGGGSLQAACLDVSSLDIPGLALTSQTNNMQQQQLELMMMIL